MASTGEYEKQEVKQSFYLYEEAMSTLRKVEILLRECCTKLPNRNQFNENCSLFAPEKYVLADSGENLKCAVTIIGDNVAKAEVTVRYPKMPSHFYRAVVQPDIQWKIPQIQDFGNYVLGAFEQIQIGLAASGENADDIVEKKILNNIDDIFQNLLSARNSLTCIQKKSQTCKMRDNLLRKCFVPLPPADLSFDLYISSSKLVFSVITTPVQASEKDPIQIYECECFIPWLYDLTVPVSHALQVMQAFLEKKMNNSKESQPKVTHEEFQNELRNFDSDQLRHIEPTEKVVLPSKEDVIQEKVEIAHQNVLVDVSQFQRHSLQHADTNERVYLPTKDEVKRERMEQAYTGVLKEVSTFERNSLTHSEPVEKYHMPTKEELAREKVMHQVPGFDQSKLKHAETVIKTTVDVIDDK